ncbi:mRNA splicing protein PRP28 SCDLUD_001937 [Saccharomycodes ludwigii]|uniref:mRNA splicing protein PRP28 n=1 Tax=Saccharomycodes ludwigii TaxID=36035 RepID=UPI001E8A95F3|nr:hypothetical protein SCDLUD_001937 [Saccharomycodes ludwigii]KAH3902124.1 hypothetical protein SCDLUD_001937 [Saccharomycodes ludwigii]
MAPKKVAIKHSNNNNTNRPLDINDILSKNKSFVIQNTNDLNFIKPRLLSKKERTNLPVNNNKVKTNNKVHKITKSKKNHSNENKQIIENDKNTSQLLDNNSIEGVDTTSINSIKYTKKKQFQFDWSLNDDTSREVDPIIPKSLKINPLKNTFSNNTINISNKGNVQSQHSTLNNNKNNNKNNNYQHYLDKPIKEMTKRDWSLFKRENNITTYKSDIDPIRNWSDYNLIPRDILTRLTIDLGYGKPTPIQMCSLPNILMKNQDFLGVAKTGSGKTLAYLIPIFIKLLKTPSVHNKFRGLILVPTRELAQQIEVEGNKFGVCNLKSIVGGHSLEQINRDLSLDIDHNKEFVLIATPGRLIDCLDMGIVDLKYLEILVLDEADRMIDLGFEEQLDTIYNIIQKTRVATYNNNNLQILMFTATLNGTNISKLAESKLKNPIIIKLTSSSDKPNISQFFRYCPRYDNKSGTGNQYLSDKYKFDTLYNEILPHYNYPIIIFVNYKKTADWLLQQFEAKEEHHSHCYRVGTIHGSKSQDQRERTLQKFRTGELHILIATDVAARGLDIPNVSLVINYQMCRKLDEYIHRIGRTARSGQSGVSVTFVNETEDGQVMPLLFKFLKKNYPLNSINYDKNVEIKFDLKDYKNRGANNNKNMIFY